MGGSLGMAAGEAVIKGLDTAVEKGCPFVLFAASGGARMQEGILSLMQMPRTTIAVQKLRETRKPYIVVLTNPTTGGVTASYAMLGDVHIAEPGALIGFAGPRVIEQTIREKLPEGFQKSEYLRDHGMVDMVVHRHDLRATIARLCRLLLKAPAGAGEAALQPAGAGVNTPRSGATSIGAIHARLLALHPKRIDLSLDRIERLLAALGHPERRLPPVDPCRRHQRQRLDHRFHARDSRSRRQARACLHLAQSGAPQRAFPHRASRAAASSSRTPNSPSAGRMRSQERRRADHGVRDGDGGGVSPVLPPSGRYCSSRSRARRPARRHQRGRTAAGQRDHARVARSSRVSRRHASRKSPARRPASSKPACRR